MIDRVDLVSGIQHILRTVRALRTVCTLRLGPIGLLSAALLSFAGCASTAETAPSAVPAAAVAPAAPKPAANPTTPISSDLALETFDAVWTKINETDFDADHGGVNWIAVRDELRPSAAQCASQEELRRVLWEMISRLNRSHFAVIPGYLADREPPRSAGASASGDPSTGSPTASATARAVGATAESDSEDPDVLIDEPDDDHWSSFGLRLRLIEDRTTVVAVEENSPAANAGVRPGWTLVSIDGRDPSSTLDQIAKSGGSMARYAAQAYVSELDAGSRRRRHELRLIDGSGTEQKLLMRRAATRATPVKIGVLPAMPLEFSSRWISDAELDRAGAQGMRIGMIHFSVWVPAVAESIDLAVDELRDGDGMILDLRGNPGGFGGMVMGVGGHFVDEPVSIGTMTTRDSAMEFRLNPRRVTRDGRLVVPFSAPLAILVDPLSASTSEVFAGGLKDIGRARIFGERSAGAALPAAMHRLPNGDVLLHAFADFRVPSGTQMEGGGVVPDEPRTLTREVLLEEDDPVLLDAIRWIRTTQSPVP